MRLNNARRVLVPLVLAIVAIITFPEKIEKAYEVAMRTLARLPRPAVALWYRIEHNRDAIALRLTRELHPGAVLCVVKAVMADLVEDGWKADLVIEYAQQPTDPHAACGEDDSGYPSVAVFTFTPAFSAFRYAGDLQSEGLPFTWTINGRFLFLNYYGTDFPWIGIWYLYDGQLKDSKDSIKLTDDSEHDYPLQTRPLPGGLIGWGTPEGLFHMTVAADGTFVKVLGLPPVLARTDSSAKDLHWDGDTFVDAEGHDVSSGLVHGSVLTLRPLVHLYISGCEAIQGFTTSALFPGAVIPVFNQAPLIRCGLKNEDEFKDFTLERDSSP
jgi:hypothetical protein